MAQYQNLWPDIQFGSHFMASFCPRMRSGYGLDHLALEQKKAKASGTNTILSLIRFWQCTRYTLVPQTHFGHIRPGSLEPGT